MTTAKEVMLGYIDGTPEQSGALFAENGTLELPYPASIGLPPVLKAPPGHYTRNIEPSYRDLTRDVPVLIAGGGHVGLPSSK
jgi:hypothetical protein